MKLHRLLFDIIFNDQLQKLESTWFNHLEIWRGGYARSDLDPPPGWTTHTHNMKKHAQLQPQLRRTMRRQRSRKKRRRPRKRRRRKPRSHACPASSLSRNIPDIMPRATRGGFESLCRKFVFVRASVRLSVCTPKAPKTLSDITVVWKYLFCACWEVRGRLGVIALLLYRS